MKILIVMLTLLYTVVLMGVLMNGIDSTAFLVFLVMGCQIWANLSFLQQEETKGKIKKELKRR